MHTKNTSFPPINYKITGVKVIDVQREKIDITALAKVIFQTTGNGAALPPDERKLVEPFLDPAYSTDDVPLLERFLVVYEKMKAGAYSGPDPTATSAQPPDAGSDSSETEDDPSINPPGNGLSF